MWDRRSIAALAPGRGAIITGGANGIGLATARQLATFGMRVCIADRDGNELKRAREDLANIARGRTADVLAQEADVSLPADLERVADEAFERFNDIGFLMNNAAAFEGGDAFSDLDSWRRILEDNVLGVLNGVQCIGRKMISRGKPVLIVNTGSKQAMTSPPRNTAYPARKPPAKV